VRGTPESPKGTLIFDIETHSADYFWSMSPEQFVRLCGYRWHGESKVHLTTDIEEMKYQIRSARMVIGHRVHQFDLPALFGVQSNEPLKLAMERRVMDSWTHAILVHPAPYKYKNRHGKDALGDSPEKMKSWFSLDEQAYQLGVQGKTADLKDLVRPYGVEAGFKGKEAVNAGFGLIPVDDQRYEEYLEGDVNASYAVAMELLKKGPLDAYAMREQELDARMFVISSNGFRVDQARAQARVDELEVRKEDILSELTEKYDFPTEGASPWASAAGKEAIIKALADYGITESSVDWPRTGTGALQLGGEVLLALTAGTPAEALGEALAELKGQRSLEELDAVARHLEV